MKLKPNTARPGEAPAPQLEDGASLRADAYLRLSRLEALCRLGSEVLDTFEVEAGDAYFHGYKAEFEVLNRAREDFSKGLGGLALVALRERLRVETVAPAIDKAAA